MALNTTANLECTLTWSHRDTGQNTNSSDAIILTDIGSVSIDEDMLQGTGSQMVCQRFHEVRTLSPSGSYSYDFHSLEQPVFGGVMDVTFSGGYIRAILIKNSADTPGANIKVVATGTDGFNAPFSNGTGGILVGPKSPCLLANIMDGWRVTSTEKSITIIDEAGSGCIFSISVVGTSGT